MPKDESLPAALAYRSFLPGTEGVLDLRGNGITVAYDFIGPSPEVNNLADFASRSRQLAGALVHLGTGDMLQVIFNREPAPEPPERVFTHRAAAMVDAERRTQFAAENHWLTPARLYLTHAFDPPVRSWLRSMLFAADGPQRQTRNELLREYALNRFAAFEDAAAGAAGLRRLSNLETFRELMLDVVYHEYPAALPEPHVRLNEVIGCERFIGGLKPYVNGYHLRPLSITAYPAMTVPQLLAVLLRQPGRMTVCARFICRDAYDARRDLEDEKRHWNREIIGTMWKVIKGWFGGSQQADRDSTAQLDDINAAIAASAAGMAFGWASVVAVIRDEDPDRVDLRAHDMRRECHSLGMMARIEDLHAVEAIESTHPANGTSNVERILISGANYADLVLPAQHWPGLPYIDNSEFYPPNTPTPLVCGGAGSGSPFYYPTHINGVANQLIIGPTTTGKSTLLGTMATAYLGLPDARIAWLDLDYSSFVLAHLLGADYRDLGSQNTAPLCPLAFLDQPGGLEWVFGWFERLFARWNFELDERQSEEFAFCLREARRTGVRTMSGLRAIIPGEQGRIRRILRHYTTYWKHIFDGEPATSTSNRVTVFEIRGLVGLAKRAAAPAIELILHSIISTLDGAPTWIFADEFWSLLGDEVSAEWLFDAIRTLRKKNAGLVGCTQSLAEIVNSPNCSVLLESCPGKVFLPNHDANGELVREAYFKLGLNAHEIDLIANATPRKHYYYRASIGSRLFALALGDLGRAICGATGHRDVQLARSVLAESPNHDAFLDNWLATRDADGLAPAQRTAAGR